MRLEITKDGEYFEIFINDIRSPLKNQQEVLKEFVANLLNYQARIEPIYQTERIGHNQEVVDARIRVSFNTDSPEKIIESEDSSDYPSVTVDEFVDECGIESVYVQNEIYSMEQQILNLKLSPIFGKIIRAKKKKESSIKLKKSLPKDEVQRLR